MSIQWVSISGLLAWLELSNLFVYIRIKRTIFNKCSYAHGSLSFHKKILNYILESISVHSKDSHELMGSILMKDRNVEENVFDVQIKYYITRSDNYFSTKLDLTEEDDTIWKVHPMVIYWSVGSPNHR